MKNVKIYWDCRRCGGSWLFDHCLRYSHLAWKRQRCERQFYPFTPSPSGEIQTLGFRPSVVRGNNSLSVGWLATSMESNCYVLFGRTNNIESATVWTGNVTRSRFYTSQRDGALQDRSNYLLAGATITGLANGTAYYVWVWRYDDGVSHPTRWSPRSPRSADASQNLRYVPGGTVVGREVYNAMRYFLPTGHGFMGEGTFRTLPGVFVDGRVVPIESFLMQGTQLRRGFGTKCEPGRKPMVLFSESKARPRR